MAMLALLSDMKARLGADESHEDDVMTSLIEAATARAEAIANRPLARQVAVTVYPYDRYGKSKFAKLDVWPIESVTSVKQLYSHGKDSDFAAATALTENEDFYVVADQGKLERLYDQWYLKRRFLQVIYAGGYIDPSTESPPAGSIQPPDDLQHGIVCQAIQSFNQMKTAGIREVVMGDAGRLTNLEAKDHPALVAAASRLMRVSL